MADAALPSSRSFAAEVLNLAIATEQKRRFAPVKVSRSRLIRTLVGLRPFRSEGFVVEAELFREKLLVHNYGHCGAGVTLSWGTSSLAVDLARDFVKHPNHQQPLPCSDVV
ncbi:MAG: FAD-dependent oxidoreductase [Pyrinomonadaceae bacterium]